MFWVSGLLLFLSLRHSSLWAPSPGVVTKFWLSTQFALSSRSPVGVRTPFRKGTVPNEPAFDFGAIRCPDCRRGDESHPRRKSWFRLHHVQLPGGRYGRAPPVTSEVARRARAFSGYGVSLCPDIRVPRSHDQIVALEPGQRNSGPVGCRTGVGTRDTLSD